MRVLIVNTNRERSPQTLIPLGACLVASAARAAGHDVRLLDLTFSPFPSRAARFAVRRFRPDVLGLSIRNIDNCDAGRPQFLLPEARRIAQACRSAGAETIVLGGPAVTTAPGPALSYLGGDFGVVGEGESSFPALLDAIERGADPALVSGVAVPDDGGTALSPTAPIGDLASLPDPCLADWLDMRGYRRYDAALPVQTKRGCPFNCSYCLYPLLEGPGVRLRDPESVASQVHRAFHLELRAAEFVDSVFNVPEAHAVACCEAIARLRRRVPLQTLEFNPSACSSDLIQAMNAAGFSAVGCSAESASDDMLATLGKGFTSDALRSAARKLPTLDALKLWTFMLGGPGETERTVTETAQFIEQFLTPRDLVYVSCGIRILPGTKLHAQAAAEGIVSPDDDLLRPRFYFSPAIPPERALAMITGCGFPSANIVTLSDGNHPLLPLAQRAAHMVGMSPPYWRWAPLWNKARHPWPAAGRREGARCS